MLTLFWTVFQNRCPPFLALEKKSERVSQKKGFFSKKSIFLPPGAVNVPVGPEVEIVDHVPAGGQYDNGHPGGGIHVGILGVVHNAMSMHAMELLLLFFNNWKTFTFQSLNSETFDTTMQY